MKRTNALMLAAAMSCTLASPAVRAQSAAERASQLYNDAGKLYDQKKYAEAEALYEQAWALRQSYDIAAQLGAVELEQGKHREAATHLRDALDAFPAGGKVENKLSLEARLKLAKAKIGELRITVAAAPPKTQVHVDSQDVAEWSRSVFVDPGAHVVDVTAPGFKPARRSVSVEAGAAADAAVELVKDDADAGGGAGGGVPTGRSAVPAIVLGAVGGVAIVGGAVFLGLAGGKSSDADAIASDIKKQGATCRPITPGFEARCADCNAASDDQGTFGTVGVTGLVVGGVALAAAAAYLLWPSPPSVAKATSGSAVRVAPAAGPSTRGIVVLGVF